MTENKVWIAVNYRGSFRSDGPITKYEKGLVMMVRATITGCSFGVFVEDIRVGLGQDDVSMVYYEDPDQMGTYLLLHDDSSFANFVYYFMNNRVVEIFVEHNLPLVVEVSAKGNDIDDESVSEWSETDTGSSDEDMEYRSTNIDTSDNDKETDDKNSGVGVAYSHSINTEEMHEMGGVHVELQDDDDTEYAKSDDDLVEDEEEVSGNEDIDEEVVSQGSERRRTLHQYPHFDPSARLPVFAVGMVFADARQFKEAVDRHSICEQRAVWYQKNTPNYLRVKCVDVKCPWQLTASHNKRIGELQIKVYDPNHTCQLIYTNKRASSKWLAKEFKDNITSAPSMGQSELKELIKKSLGLNISLTKAWRTKERVLRQLKCDYVKEYDRLWDYVHELKKVNTTVVLEVDENLGSGKSDFRRIYVCFDACSRGFLRGCRRIMGVDGCFLKGLCKGHLLAAVGRDANNGMFPIAWAVVDVENEINWKWFLGLLISELRITDQGAGWTLSSDRQKGLINAMGELLPRCEHRYCARHFNVNWRVKNPAKRLNTIFWMCVMSSNMADFRENMEKLQSFSPAACANLKEVDFCHWVKAYFRTDVKCDAVENNMCEAFNGKILPFRGKAIITMLEGIRSYVMNRMQKQKDKASKWIRDISPRAMEKLEEARYTSRFCKVRFAGDQGFEIEHRDDVHVVDVGGRKCTCGLWQVRGIPCPHGVSAIQNLNQDVEHFVDACYRKAAFLATYEYNIPPIPGMRFWESSGLVGPAPPIPRPRRGRPKKKRRKEAVEATGLRLSEKGQIQKCGRCGGEGHNRRGCKGFQSSSTSTMVRKRKAQHPLPTEPDRPKKRTAPCGYGIYFDDRTQQLVLHPGQRGEQVLSIAEGQSSNRLAEERGSEGASNTRSSAASAGASTSVNIPAKMSGTRKEPEAGIITQDSYDKSAAPSTPKSRPKQPVRRGTSRPATPSRRSQRILNISFTRPWNQPSSSGLPDVVDLDD